MLNDTQRLLFEKILDYNHEVKNVNNSGTQRMEFLGKLTQAKTDLKKFMDMGQRMFAPKRNTTDDGDEFLDDED